MHQYSTLPSRNLQARETRSTHVKQSNALIWSYMVQAADFMKARALSMGKNCKGFLAKEVWLGVGLKRLGPRKEHGSSSGKGAVHLGCEGSENPATVDESMVEIKKKVYIGSGELRGIVHKRPWTVGWHLLMKSITLTHKSLPLR